MTTFYRLLGFLRPYKRGLTASWALASLAMVMTVALPALTGRAVQVISTGAQHVQRHELALHAEDRHTLLMIALAILAVVLLRWGLTYWRRLIAGRVSLGVEYDLRERMYTHLQGLELGFFDRQQTGQLMSRATVDLQAVRFFLGYGLVFILQSMLTIVLAGVVMIVTDPRLGLIALAPVPFVVLISYRYGRRARPAIQEIQQRIAELTADAEENISGVRVVKAFAREARQLAALPRAASGACSTSRWSPPAWRRSTTPSSASCRSSASPPSCCWAARASSTATSGSASSPPSTSTCSCSSARCARSASRSSLAQRATASGARIFQMLDRQPRLTEPPDAPPLPPGNGHVQLRGVTLRYDGADEFGASYSASRAAVPPQSIHGAGARAGSRAVLRTSTSTCPPDTRSRSSERPGRARRVSSR